VIAGALLALVAAAGASPAEQLPLEIAIQRPQRALEIGRDPLLAGGRGGRFLLGCGLFRLDARGRPRGDLARKARPSEGYTVWDIQLRGGLHLADGSDLNAVAFVRLWNQQIPQRREVLWLTDVLAQAPIVHTQDTIRFRLNSPRPRFLARLSHPWLALLDPGATVDDLSSLGPFRRVPPQAGDRPGDVSLRARRGHPHGIDLPGDLHLRRDVALNDQDHFCAPGARVYALVFNEKTAPPLSMRRRLLQALDREHLQHLLSSVRSGREADGPLYVPADGIQAVPLLMNHDDPAAMEIADQMQAGLLEVGIRLQLQGVGGAELERRLRAPLYSAALISLSTSTPDEVLAMEARLSAVGLARSPWIERLAPALSRSPVRGNVPEVEAIELALDEKFLFRELGTATECRLLPARSRKRDLLPWLTSTPAQAFETSAREPRP
jgi:hypothetical protein